MRLSRAPFAAALALAALPASASAADQIYAVTDGNRLVSFNSDSPGSFRTSLPITQLAAGETLVGLDVRPATGQLYALGSAGRLYRINATNGVAATVRDEPVIPAGATGYGFDFNPTVDRIRIVDDADRSFRVNPDTGALAATDGNLAYAPGDKFAGRNPNVTASAYTNSVAGATQTVLFGIDTAQDSLVVQNPPNAGTLTSVGNGLGADVKDPAAFDISPTGAAYLTVNDATANAGTTLHRVDLTTGAAPVVGTDLVGLGAGRIVAIAVTGAIPDDNTNVQWSIASSSNQLRSTLLNGLRSTVSCDETCKVTQTALVGGQSVGSDTGTVQGAGRVKMQIDLNSATRARLRSGRSVRITLQTTITDGAGNVSNDQRFIRSRIR